MLHFLCMTSCQNQSDLPSIQQRPLRRNIECSGSGFVVLSLFFFFFFFLGGGGGG